MLFHFFPYSSIHLSLPSSSSFLPHHLLLANINLFIYSFIEIYIVFIASLPSLLFFFYLYCRLKFEEMFNNRIQQMMHSYPLDRVVSNGSLFWSGTVLLLAFCHSYYSLRYCFFACVYELILSLSYSTSFNHFKQLFLLFFFFSALHCSALLCSALLYSTLLYSTLLFFSS